MKCKNNLSFGTWGVGGGSSRSVFAIHTSLSPNKKAILFKCIQKPQTSIKPEAESFFAF